MSVLMGWGPYLFETLQTSYEQLTHSAGGRWKDHEIFGRAPAGQFLGPDKEPITLKGTVYSDYVGDAAAQKLREMQSAAKNGEVYTLVSGFGDCFGEFRLAKMTRDESYIGAAGVAKKIAFTAEFMSYTGPNGPITNLWP